MTKGLVTWLALPFLLHKRERGEEEDGVGLRLEMVGWLDLIPDSARLREAGLRYWMTRLRYATTKGQGRERGRGNWRWAWLHFDSHLLDSPSELNREGLTCEAEAEWWDEDTREKSWRRERGVRTGWLRNGGDGWGNWWWTGRKREKRRESAEEDGNDKAVLWEE
jgi:hypothetical protein